MITVRRPFELPATIESPDGLTVEGASAQLLSELLAELDCELVASGFPVYEFLLPGTSEARVRNSVEGLGLTAPDELVVWFTWHDGRAETEASRYFVPGFTLRTLAYVVDCYQDPAYEPFGEEEWQWDPRWLHIVGPNVGLAMRCDGDPAQPPLVRNVASDSGFGTQPHQTARQAVSMCTPVTWWIESLRNGWYRWKPDVQRWWADETFQPDIRQQMGMS
jgi:hypothetical protein